MKGHARLEGFTLLELIIGMVISGAVVSAGLLFIGASNRADNLSKTISNTGEVQIIDTFLKSKLARADSEYFLPPSGSTQTANDDIPDLGLYTRPLLTMPATAMYMGGNNNADIALCIVIRNASNVAYDGSGDQNGQILIRRNHTKSALILRRDGKSTEYPFVAYTRTFNTDDASAGNGRSAGFSIENDCSITNQKNTQEAVRVLSDHRFKLPKTILLDRSAQSNGGAFTESGLLKTAPKTQAVKDLENLMARYNGSKSDAYDLSSFFSCDGSDRVGQQEIFTFIELRYTTPQTTAERTYPMALTLVRPCLLTSR